MRLDFEIPRLVYLAIQKLSHQLQDLLAVQFRHLPPLSAGGLAART